MLFSRHEKQIKETWRISIVSLSIYLFHNVNIIEKCGMWYISTYKEICLSFGEHNFHLYHLYTLKKALSL